MQKVYLQMRGLRSFLLAFYFSVTLILLMQWQHIHTLCKFQVTQYFPQTTLIHYKEKMYRLIKKNPDLVSSFYKKSKIGKKLSISSVFLGFNGFLGLFIIYNNDSIFKKTKRNKIKPVQYSRLQAIIKQKLVWKANMFAKTLSLSFVPTIFEYCFP